ncbi:MAG TPA: response regulator transcription factor [Steroidobacteraceae bacterium]|nr:response regulator transcription factor [Steroidobacteraceae bacterium]
MAVRVMVASDAPVYCEGLERLLRDVEQIVVVGAVSCAEDAASQVRHIGPDVVLLDMSMEEAFSTAKKVAKTSKASRVVALGMPESEAEVIRCAEIGIAGYVTRAGSLSDVLAAIDAVSRGEVHCSPRIAGSLYRRVGALSSRRRALASPLGGLTAREVQVWRMMRQGLSNKVISRRLGIELSTVKNHVHSVLAKLGVHTRAEAISLVEAEIDPACASHVDPRI